MGEGIVVVNRVHPDEYYIGDRVDRLFANGSIRGVRLVTRDIPQNARKQRGLVSGSNTALRQGNPHGNLDEQFLWKITQAAQQARVVLDIHGHRGHGGAVSYPFYSESARHDPLVLGIASLLRSDKALIHPTTLYLAATLPNYVGWDLAPDTDVEALRPILEKLGSGWHPPIEPMVEFSYVGEISATSFSKYGFEKEYRQFEPLPAEAVARLALPQGSCASAWNASFYAVGEVVIPLSQQASS